jgi:hypothetical protein
MVDTWPPHGQIMGHLAGFQAERSFFFTAIDAVSLGRLVGVLFWDTVERLSDTILRSEAF